VDDGGPAPGAQVLIRDEVWLVRNSTKTRHDGYKVRVIGATGLVRDQEATFFTKLDEVRELSPEQTKLIPDVSSGFMTGRLFLEAVLRKTPLPQSERGLALSDSFLLRRNPYQQRPAELALAGLRPRILIADVVGLGKTLEIGLTLAELIRRGRGERILVVTPQQVLEQFQRELWTRFSIPLIRLDSIGIQRIQREIPAGRNPFTYYRRVIISIDTLKSVGQYRHHLENIHWDAVVIDESHNLAGGTSQRAQLAKVLAPRTDALLLASATPHSGDRNSFAELIDLLDPAAIADRKSYRAADIEHVYLRRTKVSAEVRDHIHGRWADRGPSEPLRCTATDPEERIFAELTDRWLAPDSSLAVSKDGRLFPYNLLKSFLSSHWALAATVTARLKTLVGQAGPVTDPAQRSAVEAQRTALEHLLALAEEVADDDSAKLRALIKKLTAIGVAPGSPTRVVVFSERVPTLEWLGRVVPGRLGFSGKAAVNAVRVMHGKISDQDEQRFIEEFGLASSPVRILITGDVASEGVNLHQQCHYLIHYDLPWSLIRIEQRNGRIDRYGQLQQPQFAALILTSSHPGAKDDRTVAEKLLEREAAAHKSLGTAETVTGLYDAGKEEDRLTRDLLAGKTVEESLADSPHDDLLASLLAPAGAADIRPDPARADQPSLFESTADFVDHALRELYDRSNPLEIAREGAVLALTPPPDLRRRLSVLPPSYLKEQHVYDRLLVTFDQDTANDHLLRAVERGESTWPTVGHASDLHPLVEWLVDRLLTRLGRQQAPVLAAAVDDPTFLVQGVFSNALGRSTVVEWMAVTGLPDAPTVRPMFDALETGGVGPGMTNRGRAADVAALENLVPLAVAAARDHLGRQRAAWDERIEHQLQTHLGRVDQWEQLSLPGLGEETRRERRVREVAADQRRLADSLRTAGEPFLRVLAVLEPTR
jgi:superfamily II DNA or RNA helicase